jgi:hypothetical protein
MLCLKFAKVYNCESCFFLFKFIVVKPSIRPDIRYPAGYPAKTVSGASLTFVKAEVQFKIRDENLFGFWILTSHENIVVTKFRTGAGKYFAKFPQIQAKLAKFCKIRMEISM